MNIMGIVAVIANQRHVAAVRRGVLLNMPLVVIGAFSTMLANVSVPWYQELMMALFGPHWDVLWRAITDASLNGFSILLVISISYFLAESYDQVSSSPICSLTVALVSFVCLMMLIQPLSREESTGLTFGWAGVNGIFFAIFAALTSAEILLRLFSIQRVKIRHFADVADPILSQGLACILPAAGTILVFAFIRMGAAAANIQDLHTHFYALLEGLFQTIQSPLAEMIIFNLLVHLLWFFGLHGNNIMEPVLANIHLANIQSVDPFIGVNGQLGIGFTKTFFDCFVLIGGAGSTISLMLALFLGSRRGNMAWLSRLSVAPAIFNINELLIFGLPIVLNPFFFIPFILVPIVLTCVSYLAISMGWVAIVVQNVHWTTPPLFSGYLATNSWSGVGLQLLEIVIGVLIYLPFVLINEKQKAEETKKAFKILLDEAKTISPQFRKELLNRHDGAGILTRMLVHDLKHAADKGELFLEYQPQVNQDNRVVGVEALLRWSHNLYGRIPPLLTIAIAEEAGFIQNIGSWVIHTACQQLSQWKSVGVDGIRMSVNVSAAQLQDPLFINGLFSALASNQLQPQDLEIEVTENIALTNDSVTNDNLAKLRTNGVRIAIDDFGMGHTSLRYIKHFPVDTLKIDGMLSRDIIRDKNCQEIISSIVSLCSSLNIETIVEYVETREQRDLLKQLGCLRYQGYYYSKPLLPIQLIEYVLIQNKMDLCEVAICSEADCKTNG